MPCVIHGFHVEEGELVALMDESICDGLSLGGQLRPVISCIKYDMIFQGKPPRLTARRCMANAEIKECMIDHILPRRSLHA